MKKKRTVHARSGLCASSLIISALLLQLPSGAQAAGTAPSSKNFQVKTITAPNGKTLRQYIISGPPAPPPGFQLQRQAVTLPVPRKAAGINTLTVPAYRWVFGCSAVSGAMIAGYYDRSGCDDIYTGPTNGGVMPLDNTPWPDWTDGYGATYASCPLVASMNGLDGRTTRGSIDDYWVQYLSGDPDPYMDHWAQHAWGESIGDYMKTSQYAYGNVDGSTTFYTYNWEPTPLTCDDLQNYYGINNDGTQGRREFYQAKGYAVPECYNQPTDNYFGGGFTFEQYKAEIDAGRPVMINLQGHTVVGVGYDDSANLVYIHDTWDNQVHTMTWGGDYVGMSMWGVSVAYPTTDRISTVTVGTSPTGRAYSFDDTAFTSQMMFVLDQGSSHSIATTSPQQIGPTKYIFDKWSDGGGQSHTITVPAGPSTYTAYFNTDYQLVTQVVPMDKGTVSPPTGFFREGTNINVAVTPARNYIFSSWSGPVNDPNVNPTTVTMTGPARVIANVTGIPTLTASIAAKSGESSGRNWTIKIANSGKGLAANVRLTEFTMTQTSGPACAPTLFTSLPLPYGDIGVGGSVSMDVTMDFTKCAATAKFSTSVAYEANGGVKGSKVFRNQTQ